MVSSPDGPYADAQLGDSLFAYDYKAGSTGGEGAPSLRTWPAHNSASEDPEGCLCADFPRLVVENDVTSRKFLLALDEGLRSVVNPLLGMKTALREFPEGRFAW